ncbi:MAG: FUSC family protein, partial [Deltaproteobacteria bacterium]|nr:FUSC family protein [Deltaproteobacteria bacterium]
MPSPLRVTTPAEVDLRVGSASTQSLERLPLTRALGWLAETPPAVRFGLKYGTAMAASIWIAFASGLDWGLTIWITVMFVAQPNTGASIKKGLMRIWGSAASGLVSIAIYGLFAQQPALMLASICGAFALAVYGMTGPRYPYAWLVFGFTTSLILAKAMAGSDQIETLSFERSTLTALGVLIVFVADSLFWPVRAEEELRKSLAERCRRIGEALKQHLRSPPSERAPDETEPPPSSPLIQQLGLVEQFRDEIGVTPQRVQAFSRIALLLEGLASRTRQLRRYTETDQSAPPLRVALERLGDELNAALAEASHCLAADQAPEPFAEALEHSLAGFENERMAYIESLIRQGAARRVGNDGEAERPALPSTVAPILRDVMLLLRRLQDALMGLVNQDGGPEVERASEAAPAAARLWFRPDPIRLQLALRAGIAGGGAIVAMLAMGWSFEEDLLPMILAPIVAFILAGVSSTRGAGTTVGIGLALGILLGWLIADLASVFLFTQLDRMPLSLVYPFVIAGGAGYLIVRGSPLGPLGALFGMLTALLPVYMGDAPPQNVDTAYGLVCGLFLGEAAGLIAQRVLWPRTAMQIFTARAAAQLDLCLRALGDGERSSEAAARGKAAAGLVSAYAKQLTQLGQLHAQAHAEPVERALDDTRRAELLALTQ